MQFKDLGQDHLFVVVKQDEVGVFSLFFFIHLVAHDGFYVALGPVRIPVENPFDADIFRRIHQDGLIQFTV